MVLVMDVFKFLMMDHSSSRVLLGRGEMIGNLQEYPMGPASHSYIIGEDIDLCYHHPLIIISLDVRILPFTFSCYFRSNPIKEFRSFYHLLSFEQPI